MFYLTRLTGIQLYVCIVLKMDLILSVSSQVPTVTTSHTSYSVNRGANVTINCQVQSTTTVTRVAWTRHVGGFTTTISVAYNPTKYSGSTPGIPSLTIANATNDDSGVYTCFAKNTFGYGYSAKSDLAVIIPNAPTVSVRQGSYTVFEGNNVTLDCNISSITTVTYVYWQKTDDYTVTLIAFNTNVNKYQGASVNTSSLTILNSDSFDSGDYVCYAVNTAGTSRSPTTTLSVTSNTAPFVTFSQHTYTKNGSVTLGCSISSPTTITDVYWTRTAGGEVTTIRSSTNPCKYSGVPSLTISNFNSNDTGNYVCFGTNNVGTSQSQSNAVTPTVNIPNASTIIALTGNNVTLDCSISSNTTVTDVYWKRLVDNTATVIRSNTNVNKYQGASVNTPSLTILNSDSGDSGDYVCYAVNAAGTSRSPTTTLSVTPNTLPTVTITELMNTGIGPVTLGCSISSSTIITDVYWQRTAVGVVTTIRSSTNPSKYSGATSDVPSLSISNLNRNDTGTYVCFGANSVGTSQSNGFTLTVNIPRAPTIFALTGNNVTLDCSINSATTVFEVFWRRIVDNTTTFIQSNTNVNKYQGSTVNNPPLTILNSDSGDSGRYYCRAVNAAGTYTSPAIILSVTSSTLPTVTISRNAYTANGGSSVTLGCSISLSTTITDVYWTRTAGGTVTTIRSSTNPSKYSGTTSDVPSLTIGNLDSNDDGSYVCFGTNGVETSQSNVVTLTVNNLPTLTVSQNSYSVNSEGTVELECSVSSTTTVTNVFWTRDVGGSQTSIFPTTNTNKYIGSTPCVPSLTILNVDSRDAGTYTCSATNAAGTGQSNQTVLNIKQPTLPTVTISQNAYAANVDSSITLGCSISSTTTVTDVYWQRNIGGTTITIRSSNNPIKYNGAISGNPSLTISNLDSIDAGNYVCYGTNKAGTGKSGTTTLIVISQRFQEENENFSTISIAIISVMAAALLVSVIVSIVCWINAKKTSNNRKRGRPETYEIQSSQRDHHYYDNTDVYDRIQGPETIQNEVSFINIPLNRGSSSDYHRASTERENRYLEVT